MPTASLAITYHAPESESKTVPYQAQVVTRCEESPIAGASVYFQGRTYTTDAAGFVDLGDLVKGAKYSAVVTAEGRASTFSWTVTA